MKRVKLSLIFLTGSFFYNAALSQNVSINVLTQESGIVQKGKAVFFEVTINNTDPSVIVGQYKLKAQITIADSILIAIKKEGHNLPTGWEVISNEGNVITLSNGKDLIAPNNARTLLIALQGKNIGGPVSISGQLFFSNGVAPGIEPGSLSGDRSEDNYSTSSCRVIE